MTAATLSDVLGRAAAEKRAVAGLVVLGWEDARAYVEAAEETGAPVILQAGPGCRRHTPTPILGKMFRMLADRAGVPVVCHVDHATTLEECREGIAHGFTSVMIDGSKLPLDENIALTARVVDEAHRAGASVEGEVGVVGYFGGEPSHATAPDDAARLERESGLDALAVSVGNVHLFQEKASAIDFGALAAIAGRTRVPLVLHGGSGIPVATRQLLARAHRVAKLNIGTELRLAFGAALRAHLLARPASFDRIEILSATAPALKAAAKDVIGALWRP
ncbi:MAG: class II fructose-bisphosphate aldolase [Hyphomicrobiales bacterium]|nr:class II fructose-bisphosphate aldolase [Hyphomicrobiales bacterium]MDE2017367.1 class II fructose-bisphosphate aldolase [Hyphomicrobiales bacterium]